MSAQTRLAVIGGGVIGRTHIQTIATVPEMTLVALVEPGEAGPDLARDHGARLYRNVEDMIAAGGIDGAIVATPNHTHLPISAALLGAGIPVLLEKPVAEDMAAAARLVSLTRRSETPLLVGHHRRHNPIVRAARKAIAEGVIGDLVAATVVTTLMKPRDYFAADWRRTAGSGGPLLINLIHEIDMLRHFFGEIAEVQALVSNARRGLPVEDSAAIALRMQSGAVVGMTISDAAAGPWAWDISAGENPARFPAHPVSAHHYAGTRAGLSLPDLTLWRHSGAADWTNPMQPTRLPVAHADPYIAQIAHFAKVIARKAQPLVTAMDGSIDMACVEAIHRSGRTGRCVAVDLSPLQD
ncbi:Gfo/Idh/MocA family oxidoreductase [uncultured Paracoccus sp.]|uniref:Gfo/Idh/MocA family protein n=1 Tax=uncultured Paracoccus sp. TaxID=189685 RepID=UPI0026263666|nr:Gfo/Idh/MocA family oxidoreductase [uncultured Paracoccus sp.]